MFGRQGYPFPLFRTQALGADAGLQVRLTPEIDTFRYDNVWNTDLRVARSFKLRNVRLRVIGDMFNVFNANTVLIRNNNIAVAHVQRDRAESQPENSSLRFDRGLLAGASLRDAEAQNIFKRLSVD